MTINPNHFPDLEQWKTFAILLQLADNGDADGNGVEKLQDFVMRAQVLLDHLLEHPEDHKEIQERAPSLTCGRCNGKLVHWICESCGSAHVVIPKLEWHVICLGEIGNYRYLNDPGLRALVDAFLERQREET